MRVNPMGEPTNQPTASALHQEAALLLGLRRQDRAAGEMFVRLFQDRIYRLLLRMVNDSETALDLTQETLLKGLIAIDKFKGQSGLMTWLFRIATNLALTHRRKGVLRKTISLDAGGEADDCWAGSPLAARLPARNNPDAALFAQQGLSAQLEAALARLDPESRCLLWLREVENLDYYELSQALNLPLGTIKSRLFRARQEMREQLGKESV